MRPSRKAAGFLVGSHYPQHGFFAMNKIVRENHPVDNLLEDFALRDEWDDE